MTDQRSFNKFENEVVHQYRRNVAAAESTEDVRKHFARTVCDLLVRASDEKVRCRYEDVSLRPDDANDRRGRGDAVCVLSAVDETSIRNDQT